ncbi:pentapeptide repeat-containing protein [Metabacillus sp. GX 13764]|uniref:pentapeptide repeat-containing protein n=1 Tax=Metabacillus kandeliae TaxID=2900151 RepID=UPI001E405EC2|nr:pentapeptide repeat-containing protein [Metabacillus kandeliae]MCD7035914.1 pentapeptide repeat-containing protein [Metabacillus kandeliae]
MSHSVQNQIPNNLKPDCQNCFALCCTALPYAKSADFAINKAGGEPCRYLTESCRCSIHKDLRQKGFKGCTVYECFGAGQKVSQINDWRRDNETAEEMFAVFPVMQQLHEMLYYLKEAMLREEAAGMAAILSTAYDEIEELTNLPAEKLMKLDVSKVREKISPLLAKTSKMVRGTFSKPKDKTGSQLIGAKMREADLTGTSFRGALLIAADLTDADMRGCDMLGADVRDAVLSGADLSGSIFFTQVQANAAKGNWKTKLPPHLDVPQHWKS